MNVIARFLRGAAKLRFRLLGLATIVDVSTQQFNDLTANLISAGWRKTYVYDGVDAWIDYGKIVLERNGVKLLLEWDNWTEGSVEGPREEILRIAEQHGLKVSDSCRWAIYDEVRPAPNKSLERTREG